MLSLRQLFDRETCTYTYLVYDPSGHEALLIDPVREHIDRDLRAIAELGLKLTRVIDTHVHADHITSADTLRLRTGALTTSGPKGAPCASTVVRDGTTIPFGSAVLRAIATPGHTDDSMCYLVEAPQPDAPAWLFTGDTLLIRGCGRTDFQNGDAGALFDSVTGRIFTMREDTVVFPGHDYQGHTASTVGEELRYNPRFVGKTREDFIALMGSLALPKPAKIDEAVPANRACGRVERVEEV